MVTNASAFAYLTFYFVKSASRKKVPPHTNHCEITLFLLPFFLLLKKRKKK